MFNQKILQVSQQPVKKAKKQKPRYWNEEEDALLRAAIKKYGTDGYHKWKEVANHVPNRTYRECMQRWTKVLTPGLKKGKWSAEEDAILRRLVNEQLSSLGEGNGKRIVWNKVSQGFKGRSCKQCRERWINHLDPDVKKSEWTQDEDVMLLRFYETMPSKWAKIARQIPGRTENMVKVRWNALNRQAKKRKQNSLYYPNPIGFPQHMNTAMQQYNNFHLNNRFSLALGQNQVQQRQAQPQTQQQQTSIQRPDIANFAYNDELRKNSLYMFPGATDISSFPMNVQMHPSLLKPAVQGSSQKRKVSAMLGNSIQQTARHNSLIAKSGFAEDFPGIRRNSSLVHLQKLADLNQGRRLSFTINCLQPMEESAIDVEGTHGRRLSSFLYQDLVKNMGQVSGVNASAVNLQGLSQSQSHTQSRTQTDTVSGSSTHSAPRLPASSSESHELSVPSLNLNSSENRNDNK